MIRRLLNADPGTLAIYVAGLCLFGIGAILLLAGAAS